MTDLCKHCICRGNIDMCADFECSQHNTWYAVEQQKLIDKLNTAFNAAKAFINCHACAPDINSEMVDKYTTYQEAAKQIQPKACGVE